MKPNSASVGLWTSRTRDSGPLKIHTEPWRSHSILQNAPGSLQLASKRLLDRFRGGHHNKSAIPGKQLQTEVISVIQGALHVDTLSTAMVHAHIQRMSSWTSCKICLVAVFCGIYFKSASDVGGPGHHAHRTWIPATISFGDTSKIVRTATTCTLFRRCKRKLKLLLLERLQVTRCGNQSYQDHDQTGSGAHPASYPMGTRGSSLRGWSGRGVKLTTHLLLVPRWRMRGTVPPFPIGLHGMMLSYVQGQFYFTFSGSVQSLLRVSGFLSAIIHLHLQLINFQFIETAAWNNKVSRNRLNVLQLPCAEWDR
jgi:hypothetical protein